MAYGAMASKSDGDTFDLTDYNQIDANFQASAIDIVTTKGDLAAATGADALARVAIGANDSTLVADSTQGTGMEWQIQPACRVYNNAAIDPTPSSWHTLTFNAERFDTNTMHDTGSNTERITVPANGGGLYLIGATAHFDTSGSGANDHYYGVRLLEGGSTIIAQHGPVRLNMGADFSLSLTTLYSLDAADFVTTQVYTSFDCNILSESNYSPEFWAVWQRRT